MGGHGRSFPAELWEETFSHLTRRDLVKVVAVCSKLSGPGLSALYRVVDLRDHDQNIAATVALLRRSPQLGAKIRSATLTTTHRLQAWEQAWIPCDVIQHWVNLRTLDMTGFPFSARERDVFKDCIQRSCKALESITYHPTNNLELLGLWDISWVRRPAPQELELKLTPNDLYFADAMTHLAWTGNIKHQQGEQYDRLLNYTFHKLISLELGSLDSSDDIVSLTEKVTLFIKRHPLIEHLSMGKEKSSPQAFFKLDAQHLNHTFLPSLRSFEGFPEHLVLLFQAHIASLPLLQSLSLFSNTEDLSDVQEMFNAFHGQPFAHVAQLQVDLYPRALNHQYESNFTHLPQRNLMVSFADLCPNTIHISARLRPLHRDTLRSMFESFASVETISVPHLSLSIHMPTSSPEQLRQFFLPLAERCQELRQIIRRKPEYTQIADSVYTLRRSPAGELVRVEVEN